MEPATLPPRFIYANEIRWQQSSDSSRCCGILFECRGHEAASGQESKWFDTQMKDPIRSLGWWCFGMLWDLVSFIRLWCWKITKILGWQWSDDAMKDNPRFFEMLGHHRPLLNDSFVTNSRRMSTQHFWFCFYFFGRCIFQRIKWLKWRWLSRQINISRRWVRAHPILDYFLISFLFISNLIFFFFRTKYLWFWNQSFDVRLATWTRRCSSPALAIGLLR